MTGSNLSARHDHTSTLLPDGRVLVTGGVDAYANCSTNATAETFDPATGNWSATSSLPSAAGTGHTATRLLDGRVLVVGGGDRCGSVFNTAAVFDPTSDTWTAVANMATAREFHSAILLPDGRVLVAGGATSTTFNFVTSAEVYDPVGGTWTAVGSMGNARGTSCNRYVQPYVAALADGSVFAAGGLTSGGCSSSAIATTTAELFSLGTQTWSALNSMNVARATTTLTTLQDGKVLVAGGDDGTGPLPSAELFDPSDGSWTLTASMGAGRGSHTATLLPNGDVLIAGGLISGVTATAEIFSPDTETTTTLDSSPNPSIEGEDVTLEATVSAAAGTPTGTVEFFDGETSLGTAPLVSGLATLEVSTLSVGSHELTAQYLGEDPFAPSDSSPVTHVVDPQTFTLSVTVTGPATGTVTSDDDLINCGIDCEETYDDGTVVTLTAAAGAGATFSGWSGDDCSGTDPCMLTMDAAKSVTATFIPSGPDLLVTAVTNPPSLAAPGSMYLITQSTKNQGAIAAGLSTIRFYLSLDAVLSAGDKLLIGDRVVTALASGATDANRHTNVQIPANTAIGTYFHLACADDKKVVPESNEGNNCLASVSTIQIAKSDLLVTAVADPPAQIVPGGKFTATDTVHNPSAVTAQASSTRYYLSVDTIKDPGDQLLSGTRVVDVLTSGASSEGSRLVTVPAATTFATYRLLACADDKKKVPESDEGNNCLASTGSVEVGIPDLITTQVSGQPPTAMPGQKFTLNDTVTNQGTVSAAASKTRYYFSTDDAWSANDVLALPARSVPILAAGPHHRATSRSRCP